MTINEIIREIKDKANREAAKDSNTMYVVAAKAAISVLEDLKV